MSRDGAFALWWGRAIALRFPQWTGGFIIALYARFSNMVRFMMRKVIGLLLLLAMLSVGGFAFGQEPAAADRASHEQVMKLMEAMKSRDQAKQMLVAIRPQMASMMRDMLSKQDLKLSDAEWAEMEKAAMANLEKTLDTMPVNEMLSAAEPAYEKYLTKAEVEALTQFYISPAGQSFLAKMPVIAAEAMRAMQPVLVKWSVETQRDLQAQMKKIVEKYHPDEKKPADVSKPGENSTPAENKK